MSVSVYKEQPIINDYGQDVFIAIASNIISRFGVGKLTEFRDLLLDFKILIDEFSDTEYDSKKNYIENQMYYKQRLLLKFNDTTKFINSLDIPYHLINDIIKYKHLNQKFFEEQTTTQKDNLLTNLHLEWIIRIERLNKIVKLEMNKNQELLITSTTSKIYKINCDKQKYLLNNRCESIVEKNNRIRYFPDNHCETKFSNLNKRKIFNWACLGAFVMYQVT